MENIPTWYLGLVGAIAPLVIHFLTKSTWSRQVKSLVALGVSILAGYGGVWISGQLNPVNLVATITVVFTISQLFYDQFFKNLFNK